MRYAIWTWALLAAICLGFLVGFVCGALSGNEQAYQNRFEEEKSALAPLITDHPVFAKVVIERYSGGGAIMSGTVETAESYAELRSEFVNAIGEARARDYFAVDVSSEVQ